MNTKLFNPIKTKIVATIALLFFVLLGAGTMMAMKAPDKAKALTAKKSVNNKAKTKFATSWFTYNGTGSVTAPSSYTQISGSPTCPSGTAHICAIQATVGSGSQPVITTDLSNEITDDLDNQASSTNVNLKP